jgi:hypothetical protein
MSTIITARGAKKPKRNKGRQPMLCSMKPAIYPARIIPTRKPEYMTDTD